MPYNPELELAWKFVEKTNRNIFLTGKAGTGKTTFLHKIKNESFKRLVVVAPTGVAAINAKGVTIHSFFQMPFGPILPPEATATLSSSPNNNSSRFQRKFNKKKIDIIRSLDLLIIDEISMVRADLLDGIDQVLRKYKNKDQVFGGVQLLMIGDLQQLAPVVKNDEWQLLQPYYRTAFFFSSQAFQQANALGIELKHIYRQDNKSFISILNEIRNNRLSPASLEALNQRYQPDFVPNADDGYITLTTHNNRAYDMNREELRKIKRQTRTFEAIVKDDFPEYAYPTDEKLELKIGAQVMFIKNDSSPEKRYFNGKIGKIVAMDNQEVTVRCPKDSEDITAERETWDNIKYDIDKESKEIKENIIGSYSQIPLKLAWAITIHKSQGLTFEKAIIDAASSFAHGQTYVALSRCKTLEGIVLKSRINKNAIIQDTRVISFTQNVEEHQPDEQHLNQSKREYQLHLIDELFSFRDFPYLINRCNKVVYQSGNSLKGNMIEPLKIIKEKGVQELIDIGKRFNTQMARMSQENGEVESNAAIQERITKAIDYFIKHAEEFVMKPLSEITYTSDNKLIKKDFKEHLDKLTELTEQKMFILKGLTAGFKTMQYLELRAKSLLQKQNASKTEKEKPSYEAESNPKLFKTLKNLRNIMAMDEDVPHYQIFTQASLLEICEKLPQNTQQLLSIKGMGKVRVKKYGDDILDIVKSYCKINDINADDNPEEIQEVKKKKHNKGDTNKISLQLFRSGKSIDEIAEERGYTRSTIESHFIPFIQNGELKLEELMDKTKADILRRLIKSTKFEGISDLKTQLGNKFSYGELKMVVADIERKKESFYSTQK